MTKGVVVYDSVYGNTELVAKMIADALEARGHSAVLVRAKDALGSAVEGDVLFMGSPTRMGAMTGKMRKFLKRVDAARWSGKPAAAFDTEMQDVIEKDGASAAAKIHDLARSRGIKVYTPVLKVGVTGIKGPLAPGSEEAVGAYVEEFLGSA